MNNLFWCNIVDLDLCNNCKIVFKANSDGAVFSSTYSVGMGMGIRNSRGEVIAAMVERIPLPNFVVEVEALACCCTMKFAFEIGIPKDFSRET
nr:hypothetical protein CFP56_54718 [Quercus suber]